MAIFLVVYVQCKWLCFVDLLSEKKYPNISFSRGGGIEPVNPFRKYGSGWYIVNRSCKAFLYLLHEIIG